MSCTSTPLRKPAPVGILCALALSAVAAFGCFRVWRQSAPLLQAYDLPSYARESLLPHLAFGRAAYRPKRYLAIFDGSNLATDEMLATDPVHITVRPVFAPPRQFTAWLRAAIYHGNTLFQVLEFPLVGSAVCLILLLLGGVMFDAEQTTAFRCGRKLRGPDLLSARHFNRRIRGNGLTFQLDQSRRGSHSFARIKGSRLRVEKRHESQHIQIIGDPGSGKTQAIMQILDQAEAQDEAAIIYDPHLEFAARYYRPDRGDLIANPLDERCFSWCPTDELDLSDSATAEATVLAQAESLYPGRPTDKDWFFIHTSRLIYKHLLVHHQPESAHELGNWMQHPDPQIDMRVLGTELEQMLAVNAAPQRAAITSTLAQVAFALRQIPDKDADRKVWTVREWCDKRRGWIFFTNTQDTRTALRPLQSLWIDMLIRRILSQGPRPDLKPIRLILDELPTLQMLPQLQAAMTESRKTGLSIVIGFQGRSQIKALYGEESETIFSAPFTKILLRTSEPEAADWSSKIVGEIEIERPKETRPAHAFGKHSHHSFTSEIKTERLVLASQFSGLPDRCGYFRYANEVVPIKIAIVPERPKRPSFLPRQGSPVAKQKVPSLAELRAMKKAEREELATNAPEPGPQLLPRPHQAQKTT